jgi:hypothetical protein
MLIFNVVVSNVILVMHYTFTALSHSEQGHPNRDESIFTDITIKANYFSVTLYKENLIGFKTVNFDPRKYKFLMSCIVLIYKELFLIIRKFLDLSLSLNVFLTLFHCHKLNLWANTSGQASINTYLRIQLTWRTNKCTLITHVLSYYTNIHLHVLAASITFIRVVYKNTDQIQLVPKLHK